MSSRTEVVSALCAALRTLENAGLEAPSIQRRFWTSHSSGELGYQTRTQIVRLLLEKLGGEKITERSAKEIMAMDQFKARLSLIIQKRGPNALKPIRPTYLSSWVNGDTSSSPDDQDAKSIVNVLAEYAQTRLAARLAEGFNLPEALAEPYASSEAALQAILSAVSLDGVTESWRSVGSDIDSNLFAHDPHFPRDPELSRVAKQIRNVLRGRQRFVVLTGPDYSGKTTVVRELLINLKDDHFTLEDGTELPILALSLRSHQGWEVINRIAAFYRRAVGERVDEPVNDKLGEVRRLARRIPALIVMTDLDQVDQHEITRALLQDQIGEMLTIIAGQSRTRILVSAMNIGSGQAEIGEFLGTGEKAVCFTLSESGGRARALWRMASKLAEAQPSNPLLNRVEGLESVAFSKTQVGAENPGIALLQKLIVESLKQSAKDGRLFRLAGLIASSADGLQRNTLRDMLKTGSLFFSWPEDDTAILLDNLAPILRETNIGDSEARTTVFQVDRAIREPLLRQWLQESGGKFAREGYWLIARAAATKARAQRIEATSHGASVSLGRDLQALTALVASIDPRDATRVDTDKLVRQANEDCVLPPLSVIAERPSSSAACIYAFDVLYKYDLEGEDSRPQPLLEDARLRLAEVLPFFEAEQPWVSAANWKLSLPRLKNDDEEFPKTPYERLPVAARAELLQTVAIAATRLMDIDLVVVAARYIDELVRILPAAINPVHLMRVYRAEVDAGFIVGDNPSRVRDPAHLIADERFGLPGVYDRIGTVIAEIEKISFNADSASEREKRIAVGKLNVRRAEALHMMGHLNEALQLFEAIEEEERALFDGSKLRPLPILGGRGARMYTRLLLDLERQRSFEWIAYGDGLRLPFVSRRSSGVGSLHTARSLIASNARRLSKGRGADIIGAKIDAARIASLEYRFANALQLLDDAIGFAFSSGSSRDVLLELLAVRSRILTDAAAFAMACYRLPPSGFSADDAKEMLELSGYANVRLLPQEGLGDGYTVFNGRPDTRPLSADLTKQARHALDKLRLSLERTQGDYKPYSIFADYLEVWIMVIESRRSRDGMEEVARSSAVRAEIREAYRQLTGPGCVLGSMKMIGYHMHLREAERLKEGLEAFLQQ